MITSKICISSTKKTSNEYYFSNRFHRPSSATRIFWMFSHLQWLIDRLQSRVPPFCLYNPITAFRYIQGLTSDIPLPRPASEGRHTVDSVDRAFVSVFFDPGFGGIAEPMSPRASLEGIRSRLVLYLLCLTIP